MGLLLEPGIYCLNVKKYHDKDTELIQRTKDLQVSFKVVTWRQFTYIHQVPLGTVGNTYNIAKPINKTRTGEVTYPAQTKHDLFFPHFMNSTAYFSALQILCSENTHITILSWLLDHKWKLRCHTWKKSSYISFMLSLCVLPITIMWVGQDMSRDQRNYRNEALSQGLIQIWFLFYLCAAELS